MSVHHDVALREFLEVVRSDDDVLLLQVVGMGLDWIERAAATLEPDSERSIHLEFRLGPNAP